MIATQKIRYGRSRTNFAANGMPFERRELKEFYEKAAARLRHNPFARNAARNANAQASLKRRAHM